MRHIRNGGHRAVLLTAIATILSLLWGGGSGTDRQGAAQRGSLLPLGAPGPAAGPVARSLDRPPEPGAAPGTSDRGGAFRQTAPTRPVVAAGPHATGGRQPIPATTPAARRGRVALAATGPRGATQPSCGYLLSPTYEAFPSEGGQGSFSVTTEGRCFWKAVSRAPSWIVLVSGASGTGNGVVTYRVLPNMAVSRSGTVTVADQPLTIRQSAAPCCETST